jgi:hypothetical protein
VIRKTFNLFHKLIQARVVADLFFTTPKIRFFFLGFARRVAVPAQRAGVATFANIRTFACIAFNLINDEGAAH